MEIETAAGLVVCVVAGLKPVGFDRSFGGIEIVHGDASKIPFGMGTYGSRSLAVCGSAMVRATEKIINKAKKIAGHLLEASESDIELKDGQFSVAGTDKSVAWGDVTLAAYVPHNYPLEDIEPGLEETAFYDPANFTYPSGAYACEVEVDPDTGKVDICSMVAMDDFGNVVNPMIVEGQVHGVELRDLSTQHSRDAKDRCSGKRRGDL